MGVGYIDILSKAEIIDHFTGICARGYCAKEERVSGEVATIMCRVSYRQTSLSLIPIEEIQGGLLQISLGFFFV